MAGILDMIFGGGGNYEVPAEARNLLNQEITDAEIARQLKGMAVPNYQALLQQQAGLQKALQPTNMQLATMASYLLGPRIEANQQGRYGNYQMQAGPRMPTQQPQQAQWPAQGPGPQQQMAPQPFAQQPTQPQVEQKQWYTPTAQGTPPPTNIAYNPEMTSALTAAIQASQAASTPPTPAPTSTPASTPPPTPTPAVAAPTPPAGADVVRSGNGQWQAWKEGNKWRVVSPTGETWTMPLMMGSQANAIKGARDNPQTYAAFKQ